MRKRVTGERLVTSEGSFNPTWQRHVAAYAHAADVLPDGRLLDLGCGTGHSFDLLSPRETVGVDIDPGALDGQQRETVVADMRALPFEEGSFDAVLSAQSLEHVPDPERILAEVRRVLRPGGTAMFVTPNRLTFGKPNEIIDPYHYVEFDQHQLRSLCEGFFARVELAGVFGSERYTELHAAERERLDEILRLDPLRLRRLIPRPLKKRLYDHRLSVERLDRPNPRAAEIEVGDFYVAEEELDSSLDLIALCRGANVAGSAGGLGRI